MAEVGTFPELEREAARARFERSPESGRSLDRSSALLRRALERARALGPGAAAGGAQGTSAAAHTEAQEALAEVSGRLLPAKRPGPAQSGGIGQPTAKRTPPEEVILDVSGRLCRTRRDVLSALGPSPFLEAELEDFGGGGQQEPIVLGCPEEAFEELHHALASAHRDLQAGLRSICLGLAGPSGPNLGELLDFFGMGWLRGRQHTLPASLATTKGMIWIERLKELTRGGVLRHLADRSLLLCSFEDTMACGKRPEPGMIHVVRETKWARVLSKEQAVAQVLGLPLHPWSAGCSAGPKGCFQPNVLRDGDRLIFDVGRRRFLHLEGLVLGLTAMERDEEVSVRLEVAGNSESKSSCETSRQIRYREHAFAEDSAGGWTMAPQTCSALVVDVKNASSPLVGRMFAVTCTIAGGGTLGFYHAELFGRCFEAPAGFKAAEGTAKPFAFDHISTLHCCQSQDCFYPEELGFLRSFGLLDPALQQELDELEWDDYDAGETV